MVVYFSVCRHAEVMKKIIQTVAEGGGELGVHMYPLDVVVSFAGHVSLKQCQCHGWEQKGINNNNNNDFISKALFHVKHAQLRCTMPMNNTHTRARARQKHLTKGQ